MSDFVLTEVAGMFMLMIIILVPVAGVTARFAIKPLVESLAKWRHGDSPISCQQFQAMEERVLALEEQLHSLEDSTRFDHQLSADISSGGEVTRHAARNRGA